MADSNRDIQMSSDSSTAIIADVMRRKHLTGGDVPIEKHFNPEGDDRDLHSLLETISSSKRYFQAQGPAYMHAGCGYTWWPSEAECIIDLRRQKIIYKFDKKCKKCKVNCNAKPEFAVPAIEGMAKSAVKTFCKRTGISVLDLD